MNKINSVALLILAMAAFLGATAYWQTVKAKLEFRTMVLTMCTIYSPQATLACEVNTLKPGG